MARNIVIRAITSVCEAIRLLLELLEALVITFASLYQPRGPASSPTEATRNLLNFSIPHQWFNSVLLCS
jgi:hypothetical protein